MKYMWCLMAEGCGGHEVVAVNPCSQLKQKSDKICRKGPFPTKCRKEGLAGTLDKMMGLNHRKIPCVLSGTCLIT